MMAPFTSMESFMEATRESTKEFTPQQLEAQEAMQETAAERTPEYWNSMAAKELNENGESDAYREYMSRAKQGGSISFGAKEGYSGHHSESYWRDCAVKEAIKGSKSGCDYAKKNLEKAIENGAKK